MPTAVLIRTRYDGLNVDAGVDFPAKDPNSRSRTLQSAKDECDVNKIMERYEKTGLLVDPLSGVTRQPQFGDFSNIGDYHAICSRIASLQSQFMLLPAGVRSRFDNDAGALLDFLADPKNAKEAVDLGLLDKSVLVADQPGSASGVSPLDTGSADAGAAAAAAVTGVPDKGSQK